MLAKEYRERILSYPHIEEDSLTAIEYVIDVIIAFAHDESHGGDVVPLNALDEQLASLCRAVFADSKLRFVPFAALCALSLLTTNDAYAQTPHTIEQIINETENTSERSARKKVFEVVQEDAIEALLKRENDSAMKHAPKDEIFTKLISINPKSILDTSGVRARMDLPLTNAENRDSLMCLAANVYHESRSAAEKASGGQDAALLTTLVRAKSGDICGAVRAKGQFSWTFDPKILHSVVDEKLFSEILTRILTIAGDTPLSGMIPKLLERLSLDFEPEFYHRYDMSVTHENPYLRMSSKVDSFFAGLKNKGYTSKQIGSHIYYGKPLKKTH